MIAILTPVLGRAHQIKPLLASIANSTTTEYQVIFIFSPGDKAISEAGGENVVSLIAPWRPGPADYAKKLAYGLLHTDSPWLFQSATDLVFYPNWDLEALKVANHSRCGVIGTNDLGNPLVKRGQHSTHSLIARSYLDTWGGVADGTGVIFSEVYDHQWTDSEFVETAKLRRQFAFARKSIVEHLHPHWGKAEMDDTYLKATRATTKDQTLFMRRRALVRKHVSQQKRHKAR